MTGPDRVPGHDALAVIARELQSLAEENRSLRRACSLALERLEREPTGLPAACSVLRAVLDGTL